PRWVLGRACNPEWTLSRSGRRRQILISTERLVRDWYETQLAERTARPHEAPCFWAPSQHGATGTDPETFGFSDPKVEAWAQRRGPPLRTALGVSVGLRRGACPSHLPVGRDSGGGIRTRDLRVMSTLRQGSRAVWRTTAGSAMRNLAPAAP